MVFQNVRQRMKKRSAMFWKTMGNVSQKTGQCFSPLRAPFFRLLGANTSFIVSGISRGDAFPQNTGME